MDDENQNIGNVPECVNDGYLPMAVQPIFKEFVGKGKIQMLDITTTELGFSDGDKIEIRIGEKSITRTLVETVPTDDKYSNPAVCLLDKGDRRALGINCGTIVGVRKVE